MKLYTFYILLFSENDYFCSQNLNTMKKPVLILVLLVMVATASAETIFYDGFEYGNQDMQVPVGWKSPDSSFVCGHLDKDHNRVPHQGEWYAFANADESWMYIQTDLIEGIHYDFSFWAISDGSFDLEMRYGYVPQGSLPTPDMMTEVLLPSAEINLPDYQKFSVAIESETTFAPYIGIHCTRKEGAWYLSIDDFRIEMMQQYSFMATPITNDTMSVYVGDEAHFRFVVDNMGYDTATLTLSANDQFFTNARFYLNGQQTTRFSIAPGERLRFDAFATMLPELNAHEISWIDIVVHSTHNCQTSMVTFWCYSLVPEMNLPYFQDFEQESIVGYDWFVLDNDAVQWKWTNNGQTPVCQPYNNSSGMMTYRASQSHAGATSVLESKKVVLDPTQNLVRFHVFRTAEMPDKADRINVYYNSKASLEDATLLTTIHRCSALSPIESEEGWHQYEAVFDADPACGFLLFEAVSGDGLDMYLDNVLIDNEPTALHEKEQASRIYPNPVIDKFVINSDKVLNVNVYSMDGMLLVTSRHPEIDLSALASGLYLVECVTANGKSIQTVMKQ